MDLEAILAKYLGAEELVRALRSLPGLFRQESRMREQLRSKLDMLCHKERLLQRRRRELIDKAIETKDEKEEKKC